MGGGTVLPSQAAALQVQAFVHLNSPRKLKSNRNVAGHLALHAFVHCLCVCVSLSFSAEYFYTFHLTKDNKIGIKLSN